MDVKPKDQLLFEKLGSKWFDLLHEQFELKYFKDLRTILAQEYSTQTIYPNSKDICKGNFRRSRPLRKRTRKWFMFW
jgi:uracil DNA glycosylase